MKSFKGDFYSDASRSTFIQGFDQYDLFKILKNIPFTQNDDTLNDCRHSIFENILESKGKQPTKLLVMYNEMYKGENPQYDLHPRPVTLNKKKPNVQLYYHVLKYCGLFHRITDMELTQWAENVSSAFDMFEKKRNMIY
jgi:hypothetical protein